MRELAEREVATWPRDVPFALHDRLRALTLRVILHAPLAEGRSVHYVARRLGHSPALTLSTYGHLFAEYEHADRIDAEDEITKAREALDAQTRAA